jgi:hypothetical protein
VSEFKNQTRRTNLKKIIAIAVAATMITLFAGCKEKTPAEKAAKKAEEAMEKTKELFE